ncbi:MAG TPA: type II secretion system F family protein [Polyangia bacterium]
MTTLILTQGMLLGAAAIFGVVVFLLVRALWPDSFLRDSRAMAEEAAARKEGAKRGANVQVGAKAVVGAAGDLMVKRLGDANERFVRPKFKDKITKRFVSMGNPKIRPQDFIAYQQLCTVFFLLLGLFLMYSFKKGLYWSVAFGGFGWFMPYIWLSDKIKKRHHQISRALPYSLDLLTLSVEAGLDFQAALGTVVEKGRPGPLQEEFGMVLSEIRLGKTREEALRNLSARVQLDVLTSFVSNLVQAERMGTSLGKILRIQSTQMRVARTHRAEKLANEAPIKMLAPLIGCIFPTVFMVLFGPILYRLMSGGGP